MVTGRVAERSPGEGNQGCLSKHEALPRRACCGLGYRCVGKATRWQPDAAFTPMLPAEDWPPFAVWMISQESRGKSGGSNLGSIIGRPVIDDHDTIGLSGLPEHAFDSLMYVFPPVVRRNYRCDSASFHRHAPACREERRAGPAGHVFFTRPDGWLPSTSEFSDESSGTCRGGSSQKENGAEG